MDLIITNLRKSYDGHVVLDGLNHTFPHGSLTCVTGPSGCGKTTLLRLIAGLEVPDAGSVTGVPKDGISMVFQEDRLPPRLDAADCLRCVLKKTSVREARIAEALETLGLSEASGQPVSEFSGGMRRRVALARALLFPASLVLLEEPFKGLDADTRRRALDFTLAQLDGRTTLLVTHDPEDVADFGGEALRLHPSDSRGG